MNTTSASQIPVTGDTTVDAALAALGDPSTMSPAEQLQAITVAHDALHRALSLEPDA